MADLLHTILNPKDTLQWIFLIFICIGGAIGILMLAGTIIGGLFNKLYDWTGNIFFWKAEDKIERAFQFISKILTLPFKITGYCLLVIMVLFLLRGLSGGLLDFLGL
jgi:hypothetical protein